jgi:hypothetical protein
MQYTYSERMNRRNFIVNNNHFSLVFLLLITLTYIQTIFSLDTINDNQIENNKFDEIRQIPLSLEKQTNAPECLLKSQLSKIINRDRRASITRPYFQHWRLTRDNSRYSTKNSLAFSPRLGKRAYENDNVDNKFVYEDSTKICLSQPISDALIQQVLGKVDTIRRNQDKEETRGRQPIGKHPVLFRYRLG